MKSNAISFRFAITLAANLVKMGTMFVTGLIIARALGVSDYGTYSFLVATCTAICSLLDMGGNHAFFTFASQKRKSKYFFIGYFVWQLLQMAIVAIGIYVLMPDDMIASIWVGEERKVIALAFLAVYMRQQMWTAMVKATEAERANHYGQTANIVIAISHLVVISLMAYYQWLTVIILFVILIGEYFISLAIMWVAIKRNVISNTVEETEKKNIIQWFRCYYKYCKPLIGLAVISFAYMFWERWVLQQYGGAVEQAYLSIGIQLSMLSRALITSMMPVIWKELAEDNARGNVERVKKLFDKSTKILFFSASTISWLLIPWSHEILEIALGGGFSEGAVVLMVMLLYPVHASLGSMVAAILLATERTGLHSLFGMIVMLISMPLAYFMVASKEALIPGLGLGALGIAVEQVGLQIIAVNLFLYYLNKKEIIPYKWKHQLILTACIPVLALLAKEFVSRFSDTLIINVILMIVVYSAGVVVLMWKAPSLTGVTHKQLIDGYYMITNRNKKYSA